MPEEIYNPFKNEVTNLKYSMVINYNEQDRNILSLIYQTKHKKARQDQLIEFIMRSYARKQIYYSKDDIKTGLNKIYEYIEKCKSERYTMMTFEKQEKLQAFKAFLAETIIAGRRIAIGINQNNYRREGNAKKL